MDEIIRASPGQRRTPRDPSPSASPTDLRTDPSINSNIAVVTDKAPVATNIFGLRVTSSPKISHPNKFTNSGLSPGMSFLRYISWNAHNMMPWYEVPEMLNLLQFLHDLGEAILAVTQQGLDNPQKDGYALLCHEIQRSRLTINEFLYRYRTRYQTFLNSEKRIYEWCIWDPAEFSKLKAEMEPQIESIKLLTLVDQM
jgi:hypothetical protein